MKNKYKFLGFLGLLPFFAAAQLTNNGATIVIEPGATLVVEGEITNSATSSITNNGVIEVKGNFVNAGTVTSGSSSDLILSGTTASQEITSGGAVFNNVEMKTTGQNVILKDEMKIDGVLSFTNSGLIDLDGNNLVFSENGAISGVSGEIPSSTKYIIADDGVGKVVKEVSADGSFTFPIGDTNDYSPLEVNHTGTYTNANLQSSVMPLNHPDIPDDADDYIERYWSLDNSGITGFSASLTGTYVPGDVQGTEGDMVGARFENGEWEFLGASQSGSTVIGSTTASSTSLTGMNFYGKTDLIVNLQGAFSGGTMTTSLTLPLTSPYLDAPRTVTQIPANAVDWIKLETRNSSNVVESVASAFILSDGSIVDENGLRPLVKDASTSSIVAIYHRNHLPIRTPAVLDVVSPVEYDFRSGLSMAYENTALANDAMIDLGSGVMGMFRANVSGDNNLNLLDFFQAKSNTSPSQTGVYSPFDVNMDGNLNLLDFFQAKQETSPSKVAHL